MEVSIGCQPSWSYKKNIIIIIEYCAYFIFVVFCKKKKI